MSTPRGLDGVLGYLGNPHPSVTIQLLFTLGLAVLGLGSPEVFTMLPVPLYSCWHAILTNDLGGECRGEELMPRTLTDDYRLVLACGERKWQPFAFPGAILAGMRVMVVLVAGLFMDVLGRRRSVVAWMGLYFVVAFSRTFSPNEEAVVLCVTLEGAAAQAVTLALLLLAAEGSTQGECVRSVCLVLLGHAVGIGAVAPLVHYFIDGDVYRQMTRSLPALVFVPFIMALPESARWAVCRGRTHDATLILKRSHHMSFDPTMKHKLAALHDEHKESMEHYGSHGHALRESVVPLVRSGRLLLTTLVFMVCGLAYGCAVSARHLFDHLAFSSFEDRQVTFGAFEFLVMLVMGLTVTRRSVKWVLVGLMSALSIALLITRVLDKTGVLRSCGGYVFISGLGHACVVLTGVWMTMGVIRLTPTHSRGLVLGVTYSMATLGQIFPYFNVMRIFAWAGSYLDVFAEIGLWAIVTFVAGLFTLLLPKTPTCLPDTLRHLYRNVQDEKPDPEEHENTQL